MGNMHNQSSLKAAAEYLRKERDLPDAAHIMEDAATALGPELWLAFPDKWHDALIGSDNDVTTAIVEKYRSRVKRKLEEHA